MTEPRATVTLTLDEHQTAVLRRAAERSGQPVETLAACCLGDGLNHWGDEPVQVPRRFLSKDRDAEESEAVFLNVLPPIQAGNAGRSLGGIACAAQGIEAISQVMEAIHLQDEVGERVAGSRTLAGLTAAAKCLARVIQDQAEEVHRAVARDGKQEAAHG